ncbi:MAG: thioredoxin family protein [Flavobacteriales bacterium]
MKLLKLSAFVVLMATAAVGLTSWSNPTPEGGELNIGEFAPMLHQQMIGVNGEQKMLRECLGENGTLIIFSCNTCPFVLQWENRYNQLYDLCEQNKIKMVLINSNEAKREGDDSYEKMKEKAKAQGYKMPYMLDEDHIIADAFGARTTPHVYLLDRNAKLAYRGAIDDNNENANEVKEHYLESAIKAMMAGEKIEPNVTKSIGCSIKRVGQ